MEELATSIFMKSAESLFDASSNVVFVLVLGSKNKLAIEGWIKKTDMKTQKSFN